MLQQSTNGNNTASNADSGARDPRLAGSVIATLPLFRDVARSSMAPVVAQASVRYARRGATIARKGERLPGVLAFAYGLAKLALPHNRGEEKVLRFVGANECFGEAAVLLDRPCPVEVVALADSMMAVIPARALQKLLGADLAFANNVAKILAGGLLGLVEELDVSTGRSSAQRLAGYLNSLADSGDGAEPCAVVLPATKTAVAARLGITKETMSRLLREMKDLGVIEVARCRITILDRERLAGIAG